ncbi:MAG TPA: glycosyltransferase, partial [bacterium]|nr:glycosyltransferase [bacterium]
SYNTLMDAVRLQKPVIVIPREGPSAEQKIRAELLAKLGLVTALNAPALLSPFELAEVMLKNLTQPKRPPIFLAMNGLTKAVSQIGNFFESKKQSETLVSDIK